MRSFAKRPRCDVSPNVIHGYTCIVRSVCKYVVHIYNVYVWDIGMRILLSKLFALDKYDNGASVDIHSDSFARTCSTIYLNYSIYKKNFSGLVISRHSQVKLKIVDDINGTLNYSIAPVLRTGLKTLKVKARREKMHNIPKNYRNK